MSSVHAWHDTRIFGKMCRSLALAGHDAHLLVPRRHGPEVETREGVTIHAVPLPASRPQRMWKTVPLLLRRAAELGADAYHLHDPELLRCAVGFQKRVGRPVIYDSHEDLRLQILHKRWIPRGGRRLVGRVVGLLEDRVACRLSGVVAATPSIAMRFAKHPRCVVVNNYPLLSELEPGCDRKETVAQGRFAYVGGIGRVRGIREMIAALPLAGSAVRLSLAGDWETDGLRKQCTKLTGWDQVEERGFLDRAGVRALLEAAQAGLVLFQPIPNHLAAQPNKMFEYMAAGLPVIASDFPLWRSIVEGAGCGLLVDPLDPKKIAAAMRWIMDHPPEARALGDRGRQAVRKTYNWDREFPKLLALYESLI
jgi:glycosyltransferase involved in cell wall biosynthesis